MFKKALKTLQVGEILSQERKHTKKDARGTTKGKHQNKVGERKHSMNEEKRVF